jgi:hypothetical protein
MFRTLSVAFISAACFALLTGCVVYEPVPAYYPAPTPAQTFDRAWNAALGALQDTGVRVTSADPATGVIRGTKDQSELFVTVVRQADGTLRVEVEAKSPKGQETGFAKRVSEAYQRRMGV